MCACCACYPYEEEAEDLVEYVDEVHGHPYLAPKPPSPANSAAAAVPSPAQAAASPAYTSWQPAAAGTSPEIL